MIDKLLQVGNDLLAEGCSAIGVPFRKTLWGVSHSHGLSVVDKAWVEVGLGVLHPKEMFLLYQLVDPLHATPGYGPVDLRRCPGPSLKGSNLTGSRSQL